MDEVEEENEEASKGVGEEWFGGVGVVEEEWRRGVSGVDDGSIGFPSPWESTESIW